MPVDATQPIGWAAQLDLNNTPNLPADVALIAAGMPRSRLDQAAGSGGAPATPDDNMYGSEDVEWPSPVRLYLFS